MEHFHVHQGCSHNLYWLVVMSLIIRYNVHAKVSQAFKLTHAANGFRVDNTGTRKGLLCQFPSIFQRKKTARDTPFFSPPLHPRKEIGPHIIEVVFIELFHLGSLAPNLIHEVYDFLEGHACESGCCEMHRDQLWVPGNRHASLAQVIGINEH